ncbi:MAG: potassium transporter, partial [Rhizobiaceae bacterium]
VRERDEARFEAQMTGGLQAGRGFMKGNLPQPVPTPLATPKQKGRAMSEETAAALNEKEDKAARV